MGVRDRYDADTRERIERALAALESSGDKFTRNATTCSIPDRAAFRRYVTSLMARQFPQDDERDEADPQSKPVLKPGPQPMGHMGAAVHPEPDGAEALTNDSPWPCFTLAGRRA